MHEYPTPSRIICIHTQKLCKTEEPQNLSFVGTPADIARNSWFQYNATKFDFVQVYQYPFFVFIFSVVYNVFAIYAIDITLNVNIFLLPEYI